MPPKRKRAEATTPADAPAKATRSSTRGKATAKDVDEGTRATAASDGSERGRANGIAAKGQSATEVAPPTKKPRTTKAAASKEKAPKATTTKGRGSKSKKVAASEADENATDGTAQTQKSSPEAKAVVPARLPVEPYTPQAAERLFESYADEDDPTVIGAEGFERLFTEAQIPMDGAMPLILAWQLGETEMAKITKGNWGKAMAELQICSLVPLALALNELYDLLILSKPPIPQTAEKKSEPYSRKRYWAYARDSNKAFRELYAFCYKLATQPGSRNIEMETAVTLWTVILAPNQPIINGVVEFANEAGSYKAVNKDLWSMMLEFCTTIKPDLSDFETDGAWPTMIDDFVNWKKAKDRPLGEQPIDV